MYKFALVLLLAASTQAKFWKDCGSAQGTVESVGVSGCKEDATECILKRNTNATITIVFTPKTDAGSIDTEVHGIIMSLPVPFPLPEPDACKDSGLSCPIKKGVQVTYVTSLPVLKSYPKVKVDVKWELKSGDDDLVCILIPAKIN